MESFPVFQITNSEDKQPVTMDTAPEVEQSDAPEQLQTNVPLYYLHDFGKEPGQRVENEDIPTDAEIEQTEMFLEHLVLNNPTLSDAVKSLLVKHTMAIRGPWSSYREEENMAIVQEENRIIVSKEGANYIYYLP